MPPIDGPWAKLAKDKVTGAITGSLPLADHGFDVAAAMEALLAGGAWARALDSTAGRPLTGQDHARLIALAALHDIGKVNTGFQARWRKGAERVGHEGQVAALMYDPKFGRSEAGQALNEIVRDWGASFSALMAHHGRPREQFSWSNQSRLDPWLKDRPQWFVKDGYDPVAEAARLVEQIRARFPLAWEPGERLPDAPQFVALFAGLMTLADWLGSDTKRFPVEGPHGAAREAMRDREAADAIATRGLLPLATPATDFTTAFDGFEPRGVQSEAADMNLGPVALIEAETGSGKTEAALWRWLKLREAGEVDGLYFALPTRTAAVQLHTRVNDMLARVWSDGAVKAVLAVPGYLRVGDAEGVALPGWEVRWDDGGDDSRWAAEQTNRYLAARVAVGTIDQALRGALPAKHAFVRAATLARSLLVVDEVHASDDYMSGLLKRLLDNHVAAGGHALLLSATLGGSVRARLLDQKPPTLAEAVAQPYPAISGTDAPPRAVAAAAGPASKQVTIEVVGLIDNAQAIAERAVKAARQGASVLVVRNSVRGAVAVAKAVETFAPDLAFTVNEVATLHHGRFAPDDRRLLDAEVGEAFGKGRSARGRILVGTQTLEQSLDIDADLLLTDLAPMDVLLQRIGRLHRHLRADRGPFADARAIVLCPAECDLTPYFGTVADRHGLGPMGDGGGVYPNLLQLEATLQLLEKNPTVSIPADNRRLVEHALHPEILESIAAKLGGDWRNHLSTRKTIAYGHQQTAKDLSLDLSKEFRKLSFPAAEEKVTTRLGEQQILVDFDRPFLGPFREDVNRIAIPHWMAGQFTIHDEPELLDANDEGQRFKFGDREYVYGRWGLSRA